MLIGELLDSYIHGINPLFVHPYFQLVRNQFLDLLLLKKVKMQNVRVYGQLQNWLYYAFEAKGDPEIGFGQAESTGGQTVGLFRGYSYPVTRQLTFGIDITF